MADRVDPSDPRVEVSYQKSAFFRVTHVDGIYGGVTPRGHIHMAVFSERGALPKASHFDVVDGQPGPEIVDDSRTGIVRELEADLVMDLPVAISLHLWMREKIEQLRVAMGVPDEEFQRLMGGQK